MKNYFDAFLKQEELGVKIIELKKEMNNAYSSTRKNIFLVVENYDISHILPELVGRVDVVDYILSIFQISRYDLNNYNPNLVNIPEMVNAIESAKELNSIKETYYINILRYITVITKNRKLLFTSEVLEGLHELSLQGLCLYYVKIPFESQDLHPEFIQNFYQKSNHLHLLELLKSIMIDSDVYTQNEDYGIFDALDSLYVRDFDICCKQLFELLKVERKRCSQSYKEFYNTFIRDENINNEALVNLLDSDNLNYYQTAWNNCYRYYKDITVKKEVYTDINRNNLVIGDSTALDCLKLFLLLASFKEMSFMMKMLLEINNEMDTESIYNY